MDYIVYNNHKDISIRLLPNGVSFSVRDEKGTPLLPVQTIENTKQPQHDSVKEAILTSGLLDENYRSTEIIADTHLFTLIPEEIYEPDMLQPYYQNTVGKTEGKILYARHIEELHLYNAFSLDENIHDFLIRTFINPDVTHYASSLLRTLKAKLPDKDKNIMIVQYEARLLTIITFRYGTLHSANAYVCDSLNNALYFILSGWKQFEYDQIKDHLYILKGGIFQEELLREISVYIKKTTLLLINTEPL